jgi:hypothetical protein
MFHTHTKNKNDVRTATNKPGLAFQFVPAAIVAIVLVGNITILPSSFYLFEYHTCMKCT